MSYVVSIRRNLPITEQELIAAVDGDVQFSTAETDDLSAGSLLLQWHGNDEAATQYFVFHRGEIDITSPSNSALKAAKSLAASLGASVIGEEGEDMSNVDLPENDDTGCGPFVWALLVAGGLLALYWIIE